MLTLHQDISDKRQAEYDVVLNTDEAKVLLETLDSGMGKRVSVNVVHDVHKELFNVSFLTLSRKSQYVPRWE